MAIILNIETSTTNCSVSISQNGNQLFLKEDNNDKYSHSERLHQYIDEVLKITKTDIRALDAIAVSMGPGSYTGLRIGVSSSKGLCFALDIPLISIPTLEILAHKMKVNQGFIVPILDARRMEVYSAVFNSNYNWIESTSAKILEPNSYSNFLKSEMVYFVGNATEKTKAIISNQNAKFNHQLPSASQMCELSFEKFKKNKFEDLAYFEPYYLKDFMSTNS